MRHVYSGPVDPPEPCCTEEPDHKDYGWPKPHSVAIRDNCSPLEVRILAEAALKIAAEIGRTRDHSDPAAVLSQILDDIQEALPGNLPEVGPDTTKAERRYWARVVDVDPDDADRWTPEEEE